jgi:hypothetical protein
LIQVDFPMNACVSSSQSADCKTFFASLKKTCYIGDTPGITQTLGWVDGWATEPSGYAVAARNVDDIAAAVDFARDNNLRPVVKGGGHPYQGPSNAPDSLLIWTGPIHDVTIQQDFVPSGCKSTHAAQRAITVGSGTIWLPAYDAVTTKAGAYVQGGGCTTVGVAGLIQSGGFGSFSKHYGRAAAGLLEAEVVSADGQVRIASSCTNSDLFWALKGGGGGTFGAVSKLTLRVRDLPELAGGANFTGKASSDDAYRRLIRRFVAIYREALFNDYWGEQAHFSPDNKLEISMVHLGLDKEQSRKVWQPFLSWLAQSATAYTIESEPEIGSMPFRHWWDVDWRKEHHHDVFKLDSRPRASPINLWWNGDAGQVGWVVGRWRILGCNARTPRRTAARTPRSRKRTANPWREWLSTKRSYSPDVFADTLRKGNEHECVEGISSGTSHGRSHRGHRCNRLDSARLPRYRPAFAVRDRCRSDIAKSGNSQPCSQREKSSAIHFGEPAREPGRLPGTMLKLPRA